MTKQDFLKRYLLEVIMEQPELLEATYPARILTEQFWSEALPLLQRIKI